MATQTIDPRQKKNNFVVEEHDGFCIVKKKKNNDHKLKILYFSSEIVEELEDITEDEKEGLEAAYKRFLKEFRRKIK